MATSSTTPETTVGTYYDGCRDALHWYAVMRDGTYYVGGCGRTLKEALADVDEAERQGKPYGMGAI